MMINISWDSRSFVFAAAAADADDVDIHACVRSCVHIQQLFPRSHTRFSVNKFDEKYDKH